jgi:3-oxo-5alpha-steroid 4-dehydrogenase
MNTDVYPQSADQIENWYYEADVVIAGYGIAGAAAAVEAASAGADVLVVERTGGWGGAAAMAGGFIYLGGGTALQKACGFDDSVENMAAFLNVAMGPGADENRIADYCASSVDHFDWLVQCGVPFKPEFWGEPGWEPPADQGLMFTGGENAFPFNTIAKPAPRGHVPQMSDKRAGEKSGGYMLMKPLVDTATSLGVRSVYNVHVSSLPPALSGGCR